MPIPQFILQILRSQGRNLLGKEFDKILGMLPRGLGEKSIFHKKDTHSLDETKESDKGQKERLNQNLEKLAEKIDQLIKAFDKHPLVPTSTKLPTPTTSGGAAAAKKPLPRRRDPDEEEEEKGGGGWLKFLGGAWKTFRRLKGAGAAGTEAAAAGGAGGAGGGAGAAAAAGGAEGAAAGGAAAAAGVGASLATLVAGFVVAADITAKLVNNLRAFSENLIATNLQFAQFSGAMAAVQAQVEIQRIQLDQIHGAARAGATLQLAQASFQTEKTLAPLEDTWNNIKADFGTAFHDLFNQTLAPFIGEITGILKETRGFLRAIYFWTDWDKKKREKDEAFASSQLTGARLARRSNAMSDWIRSGGRGPMP